MKTETKQVTAHALVGAPVLRRTIQLHDGGEIHLSLTPLQDCEVCAVLDRSLSCSCCGAAVLHRLVLDHDRGVTTCMPCLANQTYLGDCAHAVTGAEAARGLWN